MLEGDQFLARSSQGSRCSHRSASHAEAGRAASTCNCHRQLTQGDSYPANGQLIGETGRSGTLSWSSLDLHNWADCGAGSQSVQRDVSILPKIEWDKANGLCWCLGSNALDRDRGGVRVLRRYRSPGSSGRAGSHGGALARGPQPRTTCSRSAATALGSGP